ncbi:hypothetical protein ACFVW1_12550 [Streptomyces olivochromogenes]|uniref:hypothetical protein n=1 Tax=Streptomyces olivochromogenes TaxID=1963 RepID=UPI0036D8FBE7
MLSQQSEKRGMIFLRQLGRGVAEDGVAIRIDEPLPDEAGQIVYPLHTPAVGGACLLREQLPGWTDLSRRCAPALG